MFVSLQVLKDSNFHLLNQGNPEKYGLEEVRRRTVKHNAKYTVFAFLNELRAKRIFLSKTIALKIVAPKRAKKTIVHLFSHLLKRPQFFLGN